jgi:hypothetical protein
VNAPATVVVAQLTGAVIATDVDTIARPGQWKTGIAELPNVPSTIVTPASVVRFNRVGVDGRSSFSVTVQAKSTATALAAPASAWPRGVHCQRDSPNGVHCHRDSPRFSECTVTEVPPMSAR